MFRFLSVLIVVALVGMAAVNCAGGLYKAPSITAEAARPQPESSMQVDSGVSIHPSLIREIAGTDNVRVMVATDGIARSAYDERGKLWLAIPANPPASMSALTRSEAQEHILRTLMRAGPNAVLDPASMTIDDGVLREMAASTTQRVEAPSPIFGTYTDYDFAKFALEKNNELAIHALDSQAAVAKAGYLANTGIAASGAAASAFESIATILIILAVVAFFGYLMFGGKKASG